MTMPSLSARLPFLFLALSSIDGFQLPQQQQQHHQHLITGPSSRRQTKTSAFSPQPLLVRPSALKFLATTTTTRSALDDAVDGSSSPKVNGFKQAPEDEEGDTPKTIIVGDCKTKAEECLVSMEEEEGTINQVAAESISHAPSTTTTIPITSASTEISEFPASTTTITSTTEITNPQQGITTNYDIRRFRCASYLLVQSTMVGILSGWSVAIFKVLIDTVKNLSHAGTGTVLASRPWLRFLWLPLIPTMGGVIVALLSKLGGGFPPGLKDTILSVDEGGDSDSSSNDDNKSISNNAYHPIFHQFRFIKKSLASVVTLGTGM